MERFVEPILPAGQGPMDAEQRDGWEAVFAALGAASVPEDFLSDRSLEPGAGAGLLN